MKCQQEADATNRTIQLANRLVNGLASENVRWAEAVSKYVAYNSQVSFLNPPRVGLVTYRKLET